MVTMTRNEMEKRMIGLNIKLIKKGACFKVDVKTVFKNNIDLYGYELLAKGCSISPILYPETNWSEMDDDELASYLMMKYDAARMSLSECYIADIVTRENILNNVYPKLYSDSNLPKILDQDLAYEVVHDLIICFYVRIDSLSSNSDIATIKITNRICDDAGIDPSKLLDYAVRNLNKELCIESLFDKLMGSLLNEDNNLLPDALLPKDLAIVATSTGGINGASVMLSTKAMNRVATLLNTDKFYIMPSSIHEVICTPANENANPSMLLSMIKECNESVVSPEEKLTDSLYIWNNGMITKVEE